MQFITFAKTLLMILHNKSENDRGSKRSKWNVWCYQRGKDQVISLFSHIYEKLTNLFLLLLLYHDQIIRDYSMIHEFGELAIVF